MYILSFNIYLYSRLVSVVPRPGVTPCVLDGWLVHLASVVDGIVQEHCLMCPFVHPLCGLRARTGGRQALGSHIDESSPPYLVA